MNEQPDRHDWTRPPRTLWTVCHTLGRDDDGRACPACALRDLCELIERRFGAAAPVQIVAPAAVVPQQLPSEQ